MPTGVRPHIQTYFSYRTNMSSRRARRPSDFYGDHVSNWRGYPYGYYPDFRNTSPIRHQSEYYPSIPVDVDQYSRPRYDYPFFPPSVNRGRYFGPNEDHSQVSLSGPRPSCSHHNHEDDGYDQEDEFEEGTTERNRPWLPRHSSLVESEDSSAEDGHRVADSDAASSTPAFKVSQDVCSQVASLLVEGISANNSKSISKEFPLDFEEIDFSIKPPKIDNWVARRAKSKGVFKQVNASEETLTKIQLKIMDIGHPIIAFHSYIKGMLDRNEPSAAGPSIDDLARGLEASLQQWGRAFSYITKLRRETVMDAMDPRFKYLLKEKDALPTGKEARELLFSGKFVDLMLKDARDDETLYKSDKAAAAAAKGRSSSRYGHGHSSASSRSHHHGHHSGRGYHFHPYEDHRPELSNHPRGGRGRGDKGGSSSNRRYVSELESGPIIDQLSQTVSSATSQIGARLLEFANNWERITDDEWVLSTVSSGLLIDFLSEPVQHSLPRSVIMTVDMQKICDEELDNLLVKKAVTEVFDNSPGFVCSFFVYLKRMEAGAL